jgi:tryptophan synthase alpha chain
MPGPRIAETLQAAKQEGRIALIPFLPGGYPDKERFRRELLELDTAGADIIEVGVPFSDPMADGPVVEEASQACLNQGVNLTWIMQTLKELRSQLQANLVLMGYVNPFMQFGWDRLASESAEAGVSGIIVPDLPYQEFLPMQKDFRAKGLDFIPLVGLNTSLERMRLYASIAEAFVYFVSVMGTTGARQSLPPALEDKLAKARQIFNQPIALGFGLQDPSQLAQLRPYIDAVVFGSALIRHLCDGGCCSDFLAPWRDLTQAPM